MATIFIAGATGAVGSRALAIALADIRIERVVAPTRRPLPTHVKLDNPALDAIIDDPEAPAWRADGAICALGTTRAKAGSAAAFRAIDHDLILCVAGRLRNANVHRLALVSSFGANAASPLLYPRTKGEVENAVQDLRFPSLTILRPGFLDGHRAERRPVERAIGALLRFVGPILPRSARASSMRRVAEYLVEAAIASPDGRHVAGPAVFA